MPFNATEFNQEVLNSPVVKAGVIVVAHEKFNKAKDELLDEFDKHPVTKDIKAGAFGVDQDEADLMGGYGNLFAFIGFNEGTDPTDQVRQILENLELDENSIIKVQQTFFLRPKGRDPYEQILAITHLPELKGLSWVQGIEDGISNLGYFLSRLTNSNKSKSKQGYQIKNNLGRALESTQPTEYLSRMLDRFARKLL